MRVKARERGGCEGVGCLQWAGASSAPAGAEGEAIRACCLLRPTGRCVAGTGVALFLPPLSVEAVREEAPPVSGVPVWVFCWFGGFYLVLLFPPPAFLRMSFVG